MNLRLACLLCALLPIGLPALAQQAEWQDPSQHKTTMVTVEDGVQLEVLDWGGKGPPLLLLAGLGDTAHVYDDFAPQLTPRYHVVGITRRAHGRSSAPASGYDFKRLAEDVWRVIETTGLKNVVVIGHSFAGEEMHVLAARHGGIRGLVYVDAAFDRGDRDDNEAFNAVAKLVPAAPGPSAQDLASFAALRAYFGKYLGTVPEARLRYRYIANPDGSIARPWAPSPEVRTAMTGQIQAAYRNYHPDRIAVAALAIYAVPKDSDDFMRHGSSDRPGFPALVDMSASDPVLRDNVEKLYRLTRERVTHHEQWFRTFAPQARIVEVSGAHDLIISNPRDVQNQIEAFLNVLPKRR